ncbi:FAD-binding oxidoreductase [Kitasatospora purpeofusca]|uniref:FAD-binding oxidoreductase n=1 Tax=Kitasatospora purpeofusca TaxID=67352 RepID=UPI002259FAEE|nr:FAD-binding oxidoreductase [Kitasatospora purpeofusca]MCX4686547.1 FAD-binding oxidoreductase [Kitasatospora purpeofusca]
MIETKGPVHRPGDDEYDARRTGYNLALDHRPALVVSAADTADVIAAVRYAAEHGLAVAVRATGHGISVPTDGQLVIDTAALDEVTVDPAARTATVGAGVRWRQVLDAAAPHGLAPLSGSNPDVGAVGYTLGGGIGLLGRRHGFAADHVRRLEVVTADGRLVETGPGTEPDLFWALRGGKDNFGIVTAMEIDLVPCTGLYGGGLYYPAESAAAALHGWAEWSRTVPEELATSAQLISYPDIDAVPEPIRGRYAVVLRVAWSGPAEQGEDWVRPLRAFGTPLLDTVRELPFTEAGTIHHEPPFAHPAYDRNTALREFTGATADAVLELAGPDADSPLIVEFRLQGGAYSREPAVPNAVGGRDAGYLAFSTSMIGPVPLDGLRTAHAALHERLRPWSTGGALANFFGLDDADPAVVRTAYPEPVHRRLTELKTVYDPGNLFRLNFNIPPAG